MTHEKSCRNKKTGEISTIICTCLGSNSGVEILGKDGVKKLIKFDEFQKNYETITVDITPIIPNLQSYLEVCPGAKSLFYSLLRRIHPGGYFHTGDLVYVDYDSAPWLFGVLTRDTYFMQFGPDNPYIVTRVEDNHIVVHKYLDRIKDIKQYNELPGELDLPISINPKNNDAFSVLARYDTEY